MDHKGWHSRGYLPHFDSQDVVQFVTFRLADSLPKEARLNLRGAARAESLRDELLPNHVHVLLTVLPATPLGTIVSSWKRFTARKANSEIGRTGAFWQDDYWDRFIRNDDHFAATESYIDLNPVKAGLVEEAHLWPRGSARLR
jgi:REP element-mobilizing transposase RayT